MAETPPPPSGPLAAVSGRELCELQQFLLYLGSALTAAGEAVNEVIADNRLVKGALAVVKTYCPDELPEFTKTADHFKTADLVSG